ncbi:conserved hypothetical protein, membrane [Candidatus Magnetomorum sp. HK-1]|nr:conserved hypothetical protein, membrane [Candidatus Magnetomorum sp. HK-1]
MNYQLRFFLTMTILIVLTTNAFAVIPNLTGPLCTQMYGSYQEYIFTSENTNRLVYGYTFDQDGLGNRVLKMKIMNLDYNNTMCFDEIGAFYYATSDTDYNKNGFMFTCPNEEFLLSGIDQDDASLHLFRLEADSPFGITATTSVFQNVQTIYDASPGKVNSTSDYFYSVIVEKTDNKIYCLIFNTSDQLVGTGLELSAATTGGLITNYPKVTGYSGGFLLTYYKADNTVYTKIIGSDYSVISNEKSHGDYLYADSAVLMDSNSDKYIIAGTTNSASNHDELVVKIFKISDNSQVGSDISVIDTDTADGVTKANAISLNDGGFYVGVTNNSTNEIFAAKYKPDFSQKWSGVAASSVDAASGVSFHLLNNDKIDIIYKSSSTLIYLVSINANNDKDGTLTTSATINETGGISLPITADSSDEAIDVLDFTISDGGTSDEESLVITNLNFSVSGTSTDSERNAITWRIKGVDISTPLTGTYNSGTDKLVFDLSSNNISISDGGSETYTIDAFYTNTNPANLIDNHTFILTVNGASDLSVSNTGTLMASTMASVTNDTGATVDIIATQLVFSTLPEDPVSGLTITTHPVIIAQDAAGNIDTDFTDTVTINLSGNPDGSLTGTLSVAAVAGKITFTNIKYAALADQNSFQFSVDDTTSGTEGNLASATSNSITSDVVATKLIFSIQPAPIQLNSRVDMDFITDPVITAVDANGITDTDFNNSITLSINVQSGSGAISKMTATGDTDTKIDTVKLALSQGVVTVDNLNIGYTITSGEDEIIALCAVDNNESGNGAITQGESNNLTVINNDEDGTLTTSATLNETGGISLPITADSSNEAIDVLDFTISDGGTADEASLVITNLNFSVSGTSTDSERNAITWRIKGADLSTPLTGTYNSGTDKLVFDLSSNNISISNGGSETYTIDAFYTNANPGNLIDNHTFILTVNGASDLSVSNSGTQMASTMASVTNDTGATVDIIATQLVFSTLPEDPVSGLTITTHPVIIAQDAAGNIDTDFTDTVTINLSGNPDGSLTGTLSVAAVAGKITFTNIKYSSLADQNSFQFSVDDTTSGTEGDLASSTSNNITSDVVATKLIFSTQPAPIQLQSRADMDFITDPVITAVDANGITDTDFNNSITLSINVQSGSGAISKMTATGDSDTKIDTVKLALNQGLVTVDNLNIAYTITSGENEIIALCAVDNNESGNGAITQAESNNLTVLNILTVCASGCEYTSICSANEDASDNMKIVVKGGGNFTEGTLDISKAVIITTAETTEPVNITLDSLTIGTNGGLLLSDKTNLNVAKNFTNNGTARYSSCMNSPLFKFFNSGDWTFKSNNFILCNLLINKNSGITALDALSIAGSLTILSGDFINAEELTANNVYVDDTWNLNNSATINNNLTITEKGKVDSNGHSMTIKGDWINAGTFTPDENIVTFNGTSAQKLSDNNTGKNLVFDNMLFDGTELTLQTNLVVAENLTVTSGTINTNGFDIHTAGNWTNNDTFIHTDSHVYLNASSDEHTLKQTDPFYNLTIGVSGGKATIRLLSSVYIENRLDILSQSTLDVNNQLLTIGKYLYNNGNITANGGVLAFSKLTLEQESGVVMSNNALTDFEEIIFVCEPGATWLGINELNVEGKLTIDGCRLHANFLNHSGDLTLLNNGMIVRDTAIPTLNEFGIIILLLLLGIYGVIRMRMTLLKKNRLSSFQEKEFGVVNSL